MTGWEERSACADMVRRLIADGANRGDAQRHVTDLFYPHLPRGISRCYSRHLYAPAKALCDACPVRAECLDDAVANDDFRGMRGGLDPYELLDLMGYSTKRLPA